MIGEIYELIGRAVVLFVKRRYGREIRNAGLLAGVLAVLGIGAYLASRENEVGPPGA